MQRWLSEQEQPDLFGGLGLTLYTPEVPPVVEEVVAGSPAAAAGLQPGDQVLRADGVPMRLWMDWVEYVRARPGQPIDLELQRDGELVQGTIVPEAITDDEGETFGRVGVAWPCPRCLPRWCDSFSAARWRLWEPALRAPGN